MRILFPTYVIKDRAKKSMQGRFLKSLCIAFLPSVIIAAVAVAVIMLIPGANKAFDLVLAGDFASDTEQGAYFVSILNNMVLGFDLVSILFWFLYVGGEKVCLDIIRGKDVKISGLFSLYNRWYVALLYPMASFGLSYSLSYLVEFMEKSGMDASVVMAVAFLSEIVLWVISWKLLFINYVLADSGCDNIFKALVKAWRMTSFTVLVNYFMLILSFIGWFILCMFACSVPMLYVYPYYKLSVASLYDFAKQSYEERIKAE